MRDDDSRPRQSRRTVLATAGVTLAGLAGCAGLTRRQNVERMISRTFDVSDVSALVVESPVGGIDVDGGDRSDVDLTATVEGRSQDAVDDVSVAEERRDDRLFLSPGLTGAATDADPTVEFDIEIPASLRLAQAVVDVGQVDVRSVTGETRINAEVGDVSATDVNGELSVEVGTGDVEVTDVDDGGVVLSLSTGDADVTDVAGDLQASVGTGDLTVDGVGGDAVVSVEVGEMSISNVDGEVDR